MPSYSIFKLTSIYGIYESSGSVSSIGKTKIAYRIDPKIDPCTVPSSKLSKTKFEPSTPKKMINLLATLWSGCKSCLGQFSFLQKVTLKITTIFTKKIKQKWYVEMFFKLCIQDFYFMFDRWVLFSLKSRFT
jgi:hypothetical protein